MLDHSIFAKAKYDESYDCLCEWRRQEDKVLECEAEQKRIKSIKNNFNLLTDKDKEKIKNELG